MINPVVPIMDGQLYRHKRSSKNQVTVTIDPSRQGKPVDDRLFGKSAKHFGRNIDGGMHAQVLLNPTFGQWEFRIDDNHIRDGTQIDHDSDYLQQTIRNYCDIWEIPRPDTLYEGYLAGTAFGWFPIGNDTMVSSETSPEGNRTQRIKSNRKSGGIGQYTHFPLHRASTYEITTRLRSTKPTTVTIGLYEPDVDPIEESPVAATEIDADQDWSKHEEILSVSEVSDNGPYTVAVTTKGDFDIVLDRITIYPEDHINRGDPEIIALLHESKASVLRWPGGNSASSYDWQDGVGPIRKRHSRVIPAWGRNESNLFGTAEFIDFCDAVGCEPLICVNTGDGTPEEAARWVEYCNGPIDSEMGSLRAEHGYEEPFEVKYWEIGSKLCEQLQVGRAARSDDTDEVNRFHDAMIKVDPDIEILACSNQNSSNTAWNQALHTEENRALQAITDQVFLRDIVDENTDPDKLFHGVMGYANQLCEKLRDYRNKTRSAGVDSSRLAITDLELLSDFSKSSNKLYQNQISSNEALPTSRTITEALYFATILHECVRMGFVQIITHSATVNHGGGLRKKCERSWADPAHYGHRILSSLIGGLPIGVEVSSKTLNVNDFSSRVSFSKEVPVIDALAVEKENGSKIIITLVNRKSTTDDIPLELDISSHVNKGLAKITTLAGESIYDKNTFDEQYHVAPSIEQISFTDGNFSLSLSPYSLTKITIYK